MAKKRKKSSGKWLWKTIKSNKGTVVKVKCKWYSQQGRRREICFAEGGGGFKRGAIVSNRVKGKIH